jgi:cation transport ATPase
MSNNIVANDTLIKIEALQKEYESVLQQYQEAVQNYIAAIQSTSSSSSTVFTSLQGRTWWGTNGLTEGAANTQGECEAMCANAKNCSGATFNPVKHYCWARSGNSKITPGITTDQALLPTQKAALLVMSSLNDRLIALGDEISNEWIQLQPQVDAQKQEKNKSQLKLDASYRRLLEQKWEMEQQLEEYNSADKEYQDQSIFVTQTNAQYRLWLLVTLIVVLITVKKMIGLPLSLTANAIFWIILFTLLFILTFNLKQSTGFAMWAFVLVMMILMRTGIIPSL